VFAANDTEIIVDGQADLAVVVEAKRYSATFLASANVDEVILGRNWLTQNQVVWDFHSDSVLIDGQKVDLVRKHSNSPRCKRCRVGSDLEIPPLAEAVIPAHVIYGGLRNQPSEEEYWTTMPSEPIPGLRVARTLVSSRMPTAAVRVCNV